MDNKETDLYLKNELIYDTVTKYVENLKKVEKQVKYIATKMKSTSISEWGGSGRTSFEESLNKWLVQAGDVEKEIDAHRNIIDELLKNSANLFTNEKSITEDMEQNDGFQEGIEQGFEFDKAVGSGFKYMYAMRRYNSRICCEYRYSTKQYYK